MKRILITGKNSYIGTSVEKWLLKEPEKYSVDTIDMLNESWREHDFSKYDVVFHVAGIAHIKETKNNRNLYFKINRDLAYETALKAKQDGVKQFIFLSSMSVYGIEKGIIDKNTSLNPKRIHSGFIRMILKKVLKTEFNGFNPKEIIDEVFELVMDNFQKNEIDLMCNIQIVDAIEKSKSGKLRFFISNIR
jgi:UDP-glucose 4-epimerase